MLRDEAMLIQSALSDPCAAAVAIDQALLVEDIDHGELDVASSSSQAIRDDDAGKSTTKKAAGQSFYPTVVANLACKHTAVDSNGREWRNADDLSLEITSSNMSDGNAKTDVGDFAKSMDSTLFREDKNGWDECWHKIIENDLAFTYKFMNTKGGYRGFQATCKQCHRLCAVNWNRKTSEEDLQKERRKSWIIIVAHLCQALPAECRSADNEIISNG